MWQRLLFGLLLVALAYFVIQYFNSNEDFDESVPAFAPTLREPKPHGDRNLSSGGPNPPNQAPPQGMDITVSPQPVAKDPYDSSMEPADAPEQMRYPERSFGPGKIPEQTGFQSESGIGGQADSSSQAFQQFSPEFVSNGGNFFGTVSPLEDENPNYSAF